jgi:hypothetical protein
LLKRRCCGTPGLLRVAGPRWFECWHKWIPECNSIRRGRARHAKPEIWLRVLHVATDSCNGASGVPVPAYGEQTAEITLGSKGASKRANLGTVTRRLPADRVVSAVPRPRHPPKPPIEPQAPRVVELLRKAIEWQALLESGQVLNQAEIARQEGITRARVTQVMGMLRLAPEIQKHVLGMPSAIGSPITERALRPIARMDGPATQRAAFFALLGPHPAPRFRLPETLGARRISAATSRAT